MPKLDPARQARLFETCILTRTSQADAIINRFLPSWSRYVAIGRYLNLPPELVAVIHAREKDNDFRCHLHNGDPLTGRTYHVPAGRPVTGNPPFTFEESAEDALTMPPHNLKGIGDVTIGDLLVILENYNGLGYLNHNRPSPYVWAGTNQYGTSLQNSGKYVADGKFDPTVVDSQCGTAALLIRMHDRGIITLRGEPITVVNTGKSGSPRGFLIRGSCYVAVRDIATQYGLAIKANGASVSVPKPSAAAVTTYKVFDMASFNGVGYVKVRDIADFLGLSASYVSTTNTLTLTNLGAKK